MQLTVRYPLPVRNLVRINVVSSALAATLVAATPLAGQGLFTDARRAGMGGVSLSLDASLSR